MRLSPLSNVAVTAAESPAPVAKRAEEEEERHRGEGSGEINVLTSHSRVLRAGLPVKGEQPADTTGTAAEAEKCVS